MKKNVTLFINSLTSGGAERVLSIIVTELVAQNIEVELLCIEKDNTYLVPNEVKIVYLSTLSKDDSNIKKFLYLPYLAFKLKKHINKNSIELIQSHIYRANFVNLLAKVFRAKHKAEVVEVTSINNLKDGSFSKKINFSLIKLLYRHADLIVFKAERMRIEFFKNISYTGENIVINNPYDLEKIQYLSKEKIDDFEFNQNKKYMVTVGRLSSEKRHITLIEALIYLNKSIELIIIGEGDARPVIEDAIEKNNLSSRVHLLGKKENPFKYIQASDIFVLSSEGEGFPNVIIEAMVCATPVISTDCISGPREILAPSTDINFQLIKDIERAEHGILYPVDDKKALVKAINLLINDETLKKTYVKKGIEKSKEYALKKIIKKYKGALCVE